MANKYWIGTALAVAQISTVQVTAFDATTTYILTVGDKTVSVIGNTSANQTASDLADAWNASVNVLFTGVTATVLTDTVTLTADVAGLPFVAASSVTGGAGTIGAVATPTASTGPNFWDNIDNWSDAVVPVSTDTVTFRNNNVNVCFGMAQSAVTLTNLNIEQTFTGRIGLDYKALATSADGETTSTNEVEYRENYLQISADNCRIGEILNSSIPPGSGRILIDFGANKAVVDVFNTGSTSADAGRDVVRFKFNKNTSELQVRNALGGVSVANEEPDEVSLISKAEVSSQDNSTRLNIGSGTTMTSYKQSGGVNKIGAAATIATIDLDDGTLILEGGYVVTTVNIKGGTLFPNNTDAGAALVTINLDVGEVDASNSLEARTWTTLNTKKGTSVTLHSGITITNFNFPGNVSTLNFG